MIITPIDIEINKIVEAWGQRKIQGAGHLKSMLNTLVKNVERKKELAYKEKLDLENKKISAPILKSLNKAIKETPSVLIYDAEIPKQIPKAEPLVIEEETEETED